ncbi:MAG: glycoside hydrolase family 127 protein [Planctomycetales bacterium]|nr:glycoside hydrolase family 127 protein [Planctomycetales bacterium]
MLAMYSHRCWLVNSQGIRSWFCVYLLLSFACHSFHLFAQTETSQAIRLATPLQPMALGQLNWTGGFWHERMEACRTGTVPTMTELMYGDTKTQFLKNFRVAAGLDEGRHRGPSWNDGDCYKWIETLAALYASKQDPVLLATMDDAIKQIAAAQRADGYLHTPVLIRQRQGDPTALPFADAQQFELYNLGHLMLAAVTHFQATGNEDLLTIAERAADFLVNTFSVPEAPLKRSAICPAHYMGLTAMSRVTGRGEYRDLAKRLIEYRDQVEEGTDDNQDRVPFRQQRTVVGHAVRATYLYAGVADLLLDEADDPWLETLDILWRDAAERKVYITGACGAVFDSASPYGTREQETISRTHQAFGYAYQLPNSTAHNESCASVGNILWNSKMLQLTGQARFADMLERTFYNALLASISLDGTRYFYTNTLRQLDEMPVELRWNRTREPFISCFCCPPNVSRTIAEATSFACSQRSNELWCHMYGNGQITMTTANGESVRIKQSTDYPWDGRIQLGWLSAPTQEFTFQLRIPAWCHGATLTVNGNTLPNVNTDPGSYVSVSRRWRTGDVLELDLPMPVRLIQAHPLVEELRNQIAVQRGPIVYCLESPDLAPGFRVLDAALPADAEFSYTRDSTLGNAVCLETELEFTRPTTNELYTELKSGDTVRKRCRLVPYYAWDNRGQSEMSVWLPLIR